MPHALGPRLVAVLEQLAHFAGFCVLEVQLDVVVRAAGETVRGGGERGVAGGHVLPVELAGLPAFAGGPFVLRGRVSGGLSARGVGGGGQTSKILPLGSV